MARSIDYSLYIILDASHIHGRDLRRLTEEICEGGASVIQHRAKGEGESYHQMSIPAILDVASRHDVPLLINDDIELAIRHGADGVHLGQKDRSVAEARKRGGEELIIGATVHNTEEAVRATESGADYLSIGSVYHTDTKKDIQVVGPDVLASICQISRLPTVAIGGITENRIEEVLSCGVDGIAVISFILAL
jgi:thiamine-phosphate pyrophosphorylase